MVIPRVCQFGNCERVESEGGRERERGERERERVGDEWAVTGGICISYEGR